MPSYILESAGPGGKHESDTLVMDEEEDTRCSAGATTNGPRADTATDLSTNSSTGKIIKKIMKGATNGGRKCLLY